MAPPELKDTVIGDAAEELCLRTSLHGSGRARRWYRRQVVRSAGPFLFHRIKTHAVSRAQKRVPERNERMGVWLKDFQVAFRGLRKRPGFSLTVLLTLALGIGANTALFGVFRSVFLQPLDLPEADEIMIVMEAGGFGCCGPASGPDYVDWRDRNRTFEGIAIMSPGSFTLTGLDDPRRVYGTSVSASAFQMLGVAPLMGRVLLPEDEEAPGTVVLSYPLWQGTLGGRSDVLGSSVEIDGDAYTVVGVMPAGFDVPSPWSVTLQHQFYLPFPRERLSGSRGSHSYPVVARLAEGTTKETAQEDMDRIMRELAQEYPRTNGDREARVFSAHEYLFGSAGRQLALILGAALVVLLVACGNVAGLQLARAAGRETELAVRAAVGASRRALVRLLFAESLLLAVIGGGLGILISLAAVDGFRTILPSSIPRAETVGIDGTALLFAAMAAGLTALVFGMVPALLGARNNLAAGVKEGGYSTLAPRKERLRDYFIVAQIALGLVLANGAVLLVRSYAAVRGQEYGFRSEGVLTMSLNPAGPDYDSDAAYVTYYDQVLERVAAVPGVVKVGTVSRLPLFGGSNGNVLVEGQGPRTSADQGPLVEATSVTGDYFDAMGIPLLRGRFLEVDDSASGAVGVVINQALAQKAWPGEDPLGKRFSYSDDPPDWRTVVGVVGDVRQWGPERPAQGQAYLPFVRGWSTSGYLVVKTDGDPEALVPTVRDAVISVDPTQPPDRVRTMSSALESTFAQRRFYTTLIGLFAAAALFLAAAGVYGAVAYFVTRRTRELGIRMALGAPGGRVMAMVIRRGFRLAVWGILLGLVGVWATTSVVRGLVFGVAAFDIPTLVAGAVLLSLVVILASALPGLRAVRVPPVLALRGR